MIPLIVTEPELALIEQWVREEADAVVRDAGVDVDYLVGTMIETPRAALVADEIAEVAEFFSFGTNDLTQMTFGFSRDDIEGRFMSEYLEYKLLPRNPFETIDVEGVGQLVRMGCRARPRDARRRSSSASAASTVAIPRRSRSATRSASTTCRARRTACRSPGSRPRTRRWASAARAAAREPVAVHVCHTCEPIRSTGGPRATTPLPPIPRSWTSTWCTASSSMRRTGGTAGLVT